MSCIALTVVTRVTSRRGASPSSRPVCARDNIAFLLPHCNSRPSRVVPVCSRRRVANGGRENSVDDELLFSTRRELETAWSVLQYVKNVPPDTVSRLDISSVSSHAVGLSRTSTQEEIPIRARLVR